MTILFTERAQQHDEEFGACGITAWPRPPEDNIMVWKTKKAEKLKHCLSVTLTPTPQQYSS